MSISLIIVLLVLFIIAMVFTFVAFRQEENKMKKYEQEENKVEAEIERSREYEANSVRKYIPIQIWIYVISTILSIILVIYFINA